VRALVDHRLEVVIDQDRLRPQKSEVQRLISDNRLALQKMNWEPQVSFEDGLKMTFDWIKDHLDLFSNEYTL
jgi:nucleoside-diphosphate-sugar epimerase